jgi:hypothetical protein
VREVLADLGGVDELQVVSLAGGADQRRLEPAA